ncbi:YaaR family protein [Marinicrinis sediminis]|uniref:YaaR family protein n=1 Tax=Marinicrinis sediminis TaxID=1652465 RepID=A0ABW5R9I7_9BACL
MKINPGFQPVRNIQKNDAGGTPSTQQNQFSDTMRQQHQQATQQQLKQMLDQVQQQGERLLKSMTVRELRQYKLLVKRFLEETVRRGVGLKETRGWDRRGRGKKYKILEEIDQYLLEMADELLEAENGKVELLNRVGEIRGLLINLWF